MSDDTLAKMRSTWDSVHSLDLCTEARQVTQWAPALAQHGWQALLHASTHPAHRMAPATEVTPPRARLPCVVGNLTRLYSHV